MELKSIETKKIYKNIVEQIVGLISDGSLKPGDKLPPERDLAAKLNVSRASVREALSVMEIIGIIEVRPGDGTFVSKMNIAPFISLLMPILLMTEGVERDLMEIRKLLEISGARLVVENFRENPEYDAFVDELGETVDKMEIALKNGDGDEGINLDILFHKQIYARSNNSVLIKLLEYVDFILMKTIKYSRSRLTLVERKDAPLLKQHKAIYDAIAKKDEKRVATEMDKHLSFVFDSVYKN